MKGKLLHDISSVSFMETYFGKQEKLSFLKINSIQIHTPYIIILQYRMSLNNTDTNRGP